jgi:sporulation protein YlmC with PRC-barrel domain
MLEKPGTVYGFSVEAEDGTIGEVTSFLFDDRDWNVKYLIVDTGKWLSGRKVLLSPECIDIPIWDEERIPAKVNKKKVEKSPEVDLGAPLSEDYLVELNKYYGWVPLRAGILPATLVPIPGAALPLTETIEYKITDESGLEEHREIEENRHLRTTREVCGYLVISKGDEVGSVEDFLLDTKQWCLRYFIVDIGGWLKDQKRLISTEWIDSIDWLNRTIHSSVPKERIEDAPHFDESKEMHRHDETYLHDFYERPGYWM